MTATTNTRAGTETLSNRRRSAAPRRWFFPGCVILVYLALGMIAYWPVRPWSSTQIFGSGGDSVLAMWFLAWIPHSLAHVLNPWFSNSIFVPQGVNLSQNTEGPLLGLLTVPFAPKLGPVARANLLMELAMPISAASAFLVLRKWRVWGPAAAVGGLLYGFSSFALGQGLGHLVLIFLPLPPLIAMTVVAIVRGESSQRRLGIQLGLLVTAQFFCEMELTTTVVIITAGAFIFVLIRRPSLAREVVRRSWRPFCIGAVITMALLAYPVWFLVEGPQHYTGTAQPAVNPYYNDLLSFLSPGPLQQVSFGLRLSALQASAKVSEYGSYIGAPLLLIGILFAALSRRSARMQIAVTAFIGSAILSMGRHLVINGHRTPVPLPFAVLARLPLLNNILPTRLSFIVEGCFAAIIAFGLDDIYRSRSALTSRLAGRAQVLRTHGLALGVVAVVIVSQFPQWPFPHQNASALPKELTAVIPGGNPVALTYPFASPLFASPMIWQSTDNFRFRLLGGYSEHPDQSGKPIGWAIPFSPSGLDLFLDGQEGYNPYLPPIPLTQTLIALTKQTLARYDVKVLIVDRSMKGSGPVMSLFHAVAGPPTAMGGRYVIWASKDGPL